MRQALPAPKYWEGGVRPPRLMAMINQHDCILRLGMRTPGVGYSRGKEFSYDRALLFSEWWMAGV